MSTQINRRYFGENGSPCAAFHAKPLGAQLLRRTPQPDRRSELEVFDDRLDVLPLRRAIMGRILRLPDIIAQPEFPRRTSPRREVSERPCSMTVRSHSARPPRHDQRDILILSDLIAMHHPGLFRIILERNCALPSQRDVWLNWPRKPVNGQVPVWSQPQRGISAKSISRAGVSLEPVAGRLCEAAGHSGCIARAGPK